MNIKEKDEAYIAHTYQRYPIVMDHGEGAMVYDELGQAYIDFTSGIGVNIFGFCDQGWIKAVEAQLNKLPHVSNLYYSAPDTEVAQKLCERTGAKKVFFANSGAESNEGAIKIARKYSHDKYGEGRNEIITLTNSFHGRTITTLSATGQDVFHKNFMPFTSGFVHVEANNSKDFLSKVNGNICAVMIEMVQGEGGVIPLDPSFVNTIQNYCEEHDVLLVIDEVQTGVGRCGTLYAYEQYGLHPDLVTTAKGLGGGLPIGAVLMFDKCEHVLGYGDHGTTFGGNPIACAGASYILDRCDEHMLQHVQEVGLYLKQQLLKLPRVKQVDGMGLMLGVEFEGISGRDVVAACISKGAIFLTAKNRLRLLPPLIITKEQIDQGIAILHEVLSNWKG